jgi:tRNA (mo5U34)-methyltransferase
MEVSMATTASAPHDSESDRTIILDGLGSWYRGDIEGSIRCFERVRERGTASPRMLFTLGLLQYQIGHGDEGRALVHAATAERPGVLPLVPAKSLTNVLTDLERRDRNPTVRLALTEALATSGREPEARALAVDLIRSLRGGRDRLAACERPTEQALRAAIAPQPIWHSIDLGGDLFIEGLGKPSCVLAMELLRMHLPDVSGKSVLDVGAFGGFFSFEMERRGASRVTALDYYSWVTDFEKLSPWIADERARGRAPDSYNPPPYILDERGQPGRRAFDVTHASLRSGVTPVCGTLERSVGALSTHDIVLYLGVLYHMRDPLGALESVAKVCGEIAIIETLGFVCPDKDHRPIWEFYHDDAVNNDKTTWWAPSEKGLHDMLLAAGFRRVEILYGADTAMHLGGDEPLQTRIFAQAYK